MGKSQPILTVSRALATLIRQPRPAWSPLSLSTAMPTIDKAREAALALPRFDTPYLPLLLSMLSQAQRHLPIFVYGSLLNVASAKRTLSQDSLSTRQACLAYGVRRIFDADVPILPCCHWGTPFHGEARGMLNLQEVSCASFTVNGVLLQVALGDLIPLFQREEGYELRPVVISSWQKGEAEPSIYRTAYTFVRPQGSRWTRKEILPRPGYYEVSRDGAADYGPDFLEHWLDSTFLADGITPVSNWEALRKQGDPRTRVKAQKPH